MKQWINRIASGLVVLTIMATAIAAVVWVGTEPKPEFIVGDHVEVLTGFDLPNNFRIIGTIVAKRTNNLSKGYIYEIDSIDQAGKPWRVFYIRQFQLRPCDTYPVSGKVPPAQQHIRHPRRPFHIRAGLRNRRGP